MYRPSSRASVCRALVARAALCCAVAFSTPPAAASFPKLQDLDDVTVSGRVSDQDGAGVPAASVTATLISTGTTRTVTTDDEGRYRLVELPPGTYDVRVSRAGFAAAQKHGLSTHAGQSVTLDFTLRVAELTEETTVVSEADARLLDTTRTVTGGTVTREELERLPVFTRSPLDLVFLLPGIAEEPLSTRDAAEDRDPRGGAERAASTPEEAGTFSLSGGPAYSNNVTVDGLDNNDDRAARERFRPSLEAVAEVQVITNQFSSEYGRASGGRVNLRTRAGSNDLRGRLFHFFRDEALNANTWNNNRRGLKRLPLQQHVAGFTLGGPVRLPFINYDGRRRTFFFTSYEYDTQLDSALVDALVPVERNASFTLPAPTALAARRFEPSATEPNVPAELAPFVAPVNTPSRDHSLTARLDHNFGQTHNATFLLQLGRSRNLRQFGGGLRLAEALQGRTRDTEAISITDNHVFSATTVNQLRAQFSRLRPGFRADASRGPVVLIAIHDPFGLRSGTLVAGSSSAGSTSRDETRFQLQETLTLVRGSHTLKVGADLQRVRSTYSDLTDVTGTYDFTSAGDFLAGAPARFRQRFGTDSTQANLYSGLFVQDEWRPRANLTVNLGLRYERETILGDTDNFAPRLAFAYDPRGTKRTVVRFGAGVFFNRTLLRTIDDFTLGSRALFFDTNDLPAAERRPFIATNLRFPNVLTPDSPLVLRHATRRTDFSRTLDPDLRTPESYQINAGFERKLGDSLVVEANYTFNRGIRLWREANSNAPRLPHGFRDFTEYLLSRDFPNFRNASGTRPVYGAGTAGDLVRFTNSPVVPGNPDAIGRTVEFGVPVSLFNLNSVRSTTTLEAALAALQHLRPDPKRGQVERLVSAGNSFYHGLTLEARRRLTRSAGFGLSFRAAYTLSRIIDDGVVNTSSALEAGNFRRERARSLSDRRHRFVLSGTLDAPRVLGRLRFASVLRLASGAPFNVSIGGRDRNLDDVANDRPNFHGDPKLIRWREPGRPLDPRLSSSFSLPTIGQTGNLPRNAGLGPRLIAFDLNVTREFRLGERRRLRPVVEIDNLLNATTYTFGAEFINFDALGPNATAEQRRSFLDIFLVPTRTLRPRTVRLGLRFDF